MAEVFSEPLAVAKVFSEPLVVAKFFSEPAVVAKVSSEPVAMAEVFSEPLAVAKVFSEPLVVGRPPVERSCDELQLAAPVRGRNEIDCLYASVEVTARAYSLRSEIDYKVENTIVQCDFSQKQHQSDSNQSNSTAASAASFAPQQQQRDIIHSSINRIPQRHQHRHHHHPQHHQHSTAHQQHHHPRQHQHHRHRCSIAEATSAFVQQGLFRGAAPALHHGERPKRLCCLIVVK